jgi:hypothetical protein
MKALVDKQTNNSSPLTCSSVRCGAAGGAEHAASGKHGGGGDGEELFYVFATPRGGGGGWCSYMRLTDDA